MTPELGIVVLAVIFAVGVVLVTGALVSLVPGMLLVEHLRAALARRRRAADE